MKVTIDPHFDYLVEFKKIEKRGKKEKKSESYLNQAVQTVKYLAGPNSELMLLIRIPDVCNNILYTTHSCMQLDPSTCP